MLGERGLYKMKTISRLTGFSAAVLRAWETRHGFLLPVRTPSGHRLYTESDLKVLERVRERIKQGHSIGEIAVLGRDRLLAEANLGDRLQARSTSETALAAAEETRSALSPGLLEELRHAVVAAARALDAVALDAALDRAFASTSTEQVLNHVLRPAAVEIGELWAAGLLSVASEHMASATFVARMHELLAALAPASATAPVALVACLPDEQHEVGALAVALHLEQRGYRAIYLGQGLPIEDLERACEQVAPALVALSVTREALLAVHAPRLLELVRRRAGTTTFWLGGSGVTGDLAAFSAAGVLVWPPTRSLSQLDSTADAGGRGASRSAPPARRRTTRKGRPARVSVH